MNLKKVVPAPGPAPVAVEAVTAEQPDASEDEERAPRLPHSSSGTCKYRLFFPRAAWEWLDGIRLDEEFRCRVPTMRSVSDFLAPGTRRAFVAALTEVQAAHGQAGEQRVLRAWKLFFLLPRLLLTPSQQTGPQGRSCLLRRFELFRLGEWRELHRQSRLAQVPPPPVKRPNDTAHEDSRASKACALVRRGELSRARQVLTAAQLAPDTFTPPFENTRCCRL